MPQSEDRSGEGVREAVREVAPAAVAWLDVTWCLPLLGWFHGPARAGAGARAVAGPGLGDLPATAVVAAFLPGWEPGTGGPWREATGERVALVAAGRFGDGGGSWAAPSADGAGPGRVPPGAVALRDALADPAVGGFAVTWLAGRSAGEVEGAVAALLEHRDRDDVVIVALCGTDVDPRRLRGPLDAAAARRQLVVVDGDGGGEAADLALPGGDGPERTRWVLASEPGPEPAGGHPVLAAALAEGLRSGRADTDGDGDVSAEDAGRYLRRVLAVRPGVWATGTEPLLLARVPAAIPARRGRRRWRGPCGSRGRSIPGRRWPPSRAWTPPRCWRWRRACGSRACWTPTRPAGPPHRTPRRHAPRPRPGAEACGAVRSGSCSSATGC